MKAFKAMKKDQTCRGFKFEVGKTYEVEGDPVLCRNGFHFCKDLVLTLEYYPIDEDINENLYAEVEICGDYKLEEPTGHKGVTNRLKILRILSEDEVLSTVYDNCNSGNYNSGNYNSGYYNSGYRNSGYYNSGYYNSGDRNSGNYNSGYYNSGNRNSGDHNSGYYNSGNRNSGNHNSGDWNLCSNESGFFNSSEPKVIRVFGKDCELEVWKSSAKPSFLFFDLDPDLGYKGSFMKSYKEATKKDIDLLKALPNFDADIFFDISGIGVE